MWLQIRLQKLLLDSCGKDTSWSLEHWPSSWVTQGANFKRNIPVSCVSPWAFRRSELHFITLQTNGQVEWAHQTLIWMIGKLSKDWKADCPKHLPELVQAYNSTRLAITGYSPHYLMFEMTAPTHWLLFSHYHEHRKTPACQLLHCWPMWATAWSLQGSASTVDIWGWKAEVILWS